MRRLIRAFLVLAGIALFAPDAVAACAARDFAIRDWAWDRAAGWFTITGIVVNNCAEASGPHIQIVFRDETGQTVSSEDSWPAGSRNLAPGEVYPFKLRSRGYASATDVAGRVTDLRVWPLARQPAR